MSFLQPWIIWALPLALAPVIIHLIHRRRHRVVEWGAMMFLLEGPSVSRGAQRLREILLLVARTLAILGLIVGVGRPLAGGWMGRVGGEDLGAVAVVVDRSPSMAQRVQGRADSKLAAGLRDLQGALELTGGAADLVVVDGTEPDRVVPLSGPRDLTELGLEVATDATSDLPGAVETAVRYLEESAAGRAEIWVLSDGQTSDWRPGDGRWGAISDALAALPAGARVRLALDRAPAPDNLAARVTRVRRDVGEDGAALVLDVVVARTGPQDGALEPRRVPIAFEVQDGARSTAEVELIGREARLVGHRVPIDAALERGYGAVELVRDVRPRDDRFWFVFGERPTLETVVVSPRDEVARLTALAAEVPLGPDVDLVARVASPAAARDAAALDLDDAALLVWHAPLPAGDAAEAVDAFLARGGVALFLPPEADDAGAYRGVSWGAWSAPGDAPLAVETWRGDDDLLRAGDDGTPIPVGDLDLRRSRALRAEEGVDLVDLARLTGGAALLARARGAAADVEQSGRVYFLATLPTPDASDLADQGVVWLAIVQRALRLASEARDGGAQRTAGADAPTGAEWRAATELPEGASSFDRARFAGVLTDGERYVAVNRAAAEDAALLAPADAVTEALDGVDVVAVEDRGDAGGGDGLLEEVWRLFMALALVGLLVEALLCFREGDAPEPSHAEGGAA